jgi:hypothetical protein
MRSHFFMRWAIFPAGRPVFVNRLCGILPSTSISENAYSFQVLILSSPLPNSQQSRHSVVLPPATAHQTWPVYYSSDFPSSRFIPESLVNIRICWMAILFNRSSRVSWGSPSLIKRAFRRKGKTIETSLLFKPVEFDGFKIRR